MYQVILLLWVLTAASAIVLPKQSENVTDSQLASVQEVPQPPMTVQNAPFQDYVLPGYYAFNKGEPFFVEKDPLTGAIDFNKKTTPTAPERVVQDSNTTSVSKDERVSPPTGNESDYFYDDQEFPGDAIDRKDGNIEGSNVYRPNEILKNPYKISPDLHQFLNLPVHYSSSGKFPLISSSYANTKVQGTGSSSYSNHKYTVTSSTHSPSYYTFPTSPRYTTQRPTIQTTVSTTTTTTEMEEDYDNTDYSEYDEEPSTGSDNQPSESEQYTYKPVNTKYPVTTYRPTTSTTTMKPTTSSTTTTTTTEKPKQQVSIVTSLPLDVYYSTTEVSSPPTTSPPITSPPTTFPTTSPTKSTTAPTTTNIFTTKQKEPTYSTITTTEQYIYSKTPPYTHPNNGVYFGSVDEPFRPIFGPVDTENKQSNKISGGNIHNTQKPSESNEFHRLPPEQNNLYSQRPLVSGPPKLVGVEPPRPDPPQQFFPDQPIKLVPGQHSTISFADPAKINTITRPIHDHNFERPTIGKPQHPVHQIPSYSTESEKPPLHFQPQERPTYLRPNYQGTSGNLELQTKPKPEAVPYPSQSHSGVLPNFGNKAQLQGEKLSTHPPGFKMPSKVENHFIKVSPNQENPSYSLQTSFSIGVPATVGKDRFEGRPGQAVGQVLFPDDTTAENSSTDGNPNLPSQVLRPPNSRPPIQAYQPNRPGFRQPIHIQPRPPPLRVPIGELHPPVQVSDHYPRPHWESHTKPEFYNPSQNALPKKDILLPHNFPGVNRVKPDNIQRPDLPNILPQFRPNAKIGHSDYHQHVAAPERLREPLDTLQPPPLPQPQHLRINRNDDESEIDQDIPFEGKDTTQPPLVNRRSGQQVGARVTTLQMMQQGPPRKTVMRPDYAPDNRQSSQEKEKPVFLVYPSTPNFGKKPTSEGVVVIGTRGPQRPLPPANLEKDDDLDSFPLDDNKNFPMPGRDRVDTPILKTKLIAKPVVKHEFPYTIVKPVENNLPEERISTGNTPIKEYTAFSPTISSSTEDAKEHDSEINVIPYLQDYMPFAMKKTQTVEKPTANTKKDTKLAQKPSQPISTVLNASLATTTIKPITTTTKVVEKKQNSNERTGGSEFTVSAMMHTQQKPANHRIPVPVTHTPSQPQPLDFQAPFLASLSAPESQGWKVVTESETKQETDRMDQESKSADKDESKFDFENFKPQLFGGFKPILPPSVEDPGSTITVKEEVKDAVVLNKGDREEKSME